MLRYSVPPVTISEQHGRIWTTQPSPCHGGLVAVLQVPSSKFSDAVRSPDFTVVAMESRANLLVTADTRGQVYVFDIRQNRYNCLDKVGSAGTAAIFHNSRIVFVAFADCTIRAYDASKGIVVGVLREHRSPVRHMEINGDLNELLSTSVDGVLVWDIKKLRRKRVLGSGPYGALQASYTPDGLAVVTQFKDGSFYVWAVGSFALLRSFTLPVAPPLRPAQTSCCLSPNGQLLVACGPTLPVLLVYNIIGGELQYAVGLPGKPSRLDVAVRDDVLAVAAMASPSPPAAAAAGLAAQLPMSVGVQQARFMDDSTTVAALLTDGSVAFVDVVGCQFVGCVPYRYPNRTDCGFSADARMQHMALRANGKVMLYDLADCRTAVDPPQPLPRLEVLRLEDLAAAVALEHLRRQRGEGQDELQEQQRQEGFQESGTGPAIPDTQSMPDKPTTPRGAAAGPKPTARGPVTAGGSPGGGGGVPGRKAMVLATGPGPGFKRGRAGGVGARGQGGAPVAPGTALAPVAGGGGDAAGVRRGAKPDAAAVSLNRARLEALLEAFGEYPAKYRLMIWEFLLRLPHNSSAFSSLAGLGMHPAFKDTPDRLPLASRALAQRLGATLSQLAHWCPVFAESSFLPDLVFPFVKLFASSPGPAGGAVPRASAALDERCFETLATLLACGWMRGWWERFPHPPLGLLTRLQDLVALHDGALARHLAAFRGGLAGVVWPHLATLWTELLTRSDWLKLWDHCITGGPSFLYHFIAGYLVTLRSQLMTLDTDHKLANWMAGPPDIDMGEVLRTAYLLRSRTPPELQPVPLEWEPLPQGPSYVEFKGFPAGAVELFAADRARIRDAEDAIMRRRVVVAELETRTRAVALQAASLSTERQQLAALEEQRRAMLRQLEAATASELARLDDRAKEEKLRQIAAVEKAYQGNLLEVRATWQRELEYARAEMAHKRAMAAQQIRSRQEDEQIKALEFHAQQRMQAMEEDVRRAAVASAVRDELLANQMDAEAKHRSKLKEWEAEDEARKVRLQAEATRRAELAAVAEEGAARSAAAREAQALALQLEDEMVKVDADRRLRRLAEDAALVTAEARAAEEARIAARVAAEQEAMRLRAKADVAWYEAEQLRREQLLAQERQQMEVAATAARKKLADTEAAARTMAAESELLERRRFLERQNAAEEAEVRRLVGAMAAERGRDAVLMSQLEAKEEEMRAKLEHVARVGSMQREVESREAAAAAALLAQLDAQQRRELAELRREHEEVLARLGRELEGQAVDAAARRRAELREEQVAAVRSQQLVFERRKQELARELLAQADRRASAAATAAASSEDPDGPPPRRLNNHDPPTQQQPAPIPRRSGAAASDRVPPPATTAAAPRVSDATHAEPTAQPAPRNPDRDPGAAAATVAVEHLQPSAAAAAAAPPPPPAADTMGRIVLARRSGGGSGGPGGENSGVLTPTRTYDFMSDSNLTPASYMSSSYVSSSVMTSPEQLTSFPPRPAPPPPGATAAPVASAAAASRALGTHQQVSLLEDHRPSLLRRLHQQAASPHQELHAHAPPQRPANSGPSGPHLSSGGGAATVAVAREVGATADGASVGGERAVGGLARSPASPASASNLTPSLSPSVAAATSSSLISSSVRLPGRSPLERSVDAAAAAATAMQRAALVVAQAVSPERLRWDSRFGTRDPSPSSVAGGLSASPLSRDPESELGSALGTAERRGVPYGASGLGLTAYYGRLYADLAGSSSSTSPASASVLMGSSRDSSTGPLPAHLAAVRAAALAGADRSAAPNTAPASSAASSEPSLSPQTASTAAPAATAAAAAAAAVSAAFKLLPDWIPLTIPEDIADTLSSASNSPLPFASNGAVSTATAAAASVGVTGREGGGGGWESTSARSGGTSALPSDSRSSLQRSGLLGLSQPQSQPSVIRAGQHGDGTHGRYHSSAGTSAPAASGSGSSTSPALTSTTTTTAAAGTSYLSYTSFTPAVRPTSAAQGPQALSQSAASPQTVSTASVPSYLSSELHSATSAIAAPANRASASAAAAGAEATQRPRAHSSGGDGTRGGGSSSGGGYPGGDRGCGIEGVLSPESAASGVGRAQAAGPLRPAASAAAAAPSGATETTSYSYTSDTFTSASDNSGISGLLRLAAGGGIPSGGAGGARAGLGGTSGGGGGGGGHGSMELVLGGGVGDGAVSRSSSNGSGDGSSGRMEALPDSTAAGSSLHAPSHSGPSASAATSAAVAAFLDSASTAVSGTDSYYRSSTASGVLHSSRSIGGGGGGSSEAASAGLPGGGGTTGTSSYLSRSTLTRASTPLSAITGESAPDSSRLSGTKGGSTAPREALSESVRLLDGSDASIGVTPVGSINTERPSRTAAAAVSGRAAAPQYSGGGSSSVSISGGGGGAPSPDVAQLLRLLRLTGEDDPTGRHHRAEPHPHLYHHVQQLQQPSPRDSQHPQSHSSHPHQPSSWSSQLPGLLHTAAQPRQQQHEQQPQPGSRWGSQEGTDEEQGWGAGSLAPLPPATLPPMADPSYPVPGHVRASEEPSGRVETAAAGGSPPPSSWAIQPGLTAAPSLGFGSRLDGSSGSDSDDDNGSGGPALLPRPRPGSQKPPAPIPGPAPSLGTSQSLPVGALPGTAASGAFSTGTAAAAGTAAAGLTGPQAGTGLPARWSAGPALGTGFRDVGAGDASGSGVAAALSAGGEGARGGRGSGGGGGGKSYDWMAASPLASSRTGTLDSSTPGATPGGATDLTAALRRIGLGTPWEVEAASPPPTTTTMGLTPLDEDARWLLTGSPLTDSTGTGMDAYPYPYASPR